MSNRRTVRVLIADDAAAVRAALRTRLENEPASPSAGIEVIGVAATGDEATLLAMQLRPDAVILGAQLSGIGSVAAARRIRAAGAAAGVLVHGATANDPRVDEAVRSGGCVFIASDASPTELATVVRAAARGSGSIGPRMRQQPARATEARLPRPLDSLTPRELEILRFLGRGKTDKETAATLGLSIGSLRTAVRGVLRKLQAADRADAVRLAVAHGLT